MLILKTFIWRKGVDLKEIWVVMTLILIAQILIVTIVKMKEILHENDEVVDPTPRKESTKIYFDPSDKKVLFQLYIVFF